MSAPLLAVHDTRDGAVLTLKVQPGAPRAALKGVHGDGALKVAVRAPPEKGKANDEVVALLTRALGLPRGAAAIAGGETSRNKRVLFAGMGADDVRARVAAALAPEAKSG